MAMTFIEGSKDTRWLKLLILSVVEGRPILRTQECGNRMAEMDHFECLLFLLCVISGVKPNLDSYVFLRVNENTENVLVEEDTLDTG